MVKSEDTDAQSEESHTLKKGRVRVVREGAERGPV
jgi:hypothetical protein